MGNTKIVKGGFKMAVRTEVLDINDVGYALEVEVRYTCPYCNEDIEEIVSISYPDDGEDIITLCECECPKYSKYIDLRMDLGK